MDEVTERIREAIELCLEVEGAPEQDLESRPTLAASTWLDTGRAMIP